MSAADPKARERTHAESAPVPPAGEDIHLPGGSIIPLMTAVGITLTVIGSTVWLGWTAMGLIIFLIALGIWIRDVRRDVDALPEEHHHG